MLDNFSLSSDMTSNPKADDAHSWAKDNIATPLINELWINPHNVIANAVNTTIGKISGKEIISDWQEREAPEVAVGSVAWFARSMSRGIGAIAPYVVAGAITRAPLRRLSENFAAESTTAKVLRSEHTAQISGAALYDGLRDTKADETHTGNALASAGTFSILQAGNALSRVAPLSIRIPAMFLTGAVATAAGIETSKLYSQHTFASKNELFQAELSGAFMNVALPGAQHVMGSAISKINMVTGKGEPLDRYMERASSVPTEVSAVRDFFGSDFESSPLKGSLENSTYLKSLVAEHANTRVLLDPTKTDYIPSRDNLRISSDNLTPQAIAHEATHVSQIKNGDLDQGYAKAQASLALGDIDSARSTYIDTRVIGEIQSVYAEKRVTAEIAAAKDPTPPAQNAEAESTDIAEVQLLRGRLEHSMGSLLDTEFTKFQESGGTFRPESYEQASSRNQGSYRWWFNKYNAWDALEYKDKLDLARDLHRAPDSIKPQMYMKALQQPVKSNGEQMTGGERNQSWRIREIVDSKFVSLSPADRVKVFKQQLNSSDYPVRALGLSHIADLPANARLKAFTGAINHPKALMFAPSGSHSYFGDSKEQGPYIHINEKNRLSPILAKTPAQLLVESISSLASKHREDAWLTAYRKTARRYSYPKTGSETKLVSSSLDQAAVKNFDVLPLGSRANIWSDIWESKGSKKNRADGDFTNNLVEQISKLPDTAKGGALHRVFASQAELKGSSLAKAIGSLPEEDRTETWQKFFDRSSPDWSSRNLQYETTYFADVLAKDKFDRKQNTDTNASQTWRDFQKDLGLGTENREPFAVGTAGLMRGLGEAIATLPEADRTQAWHAVAASEPRLYATELMGAIPSLPAREQVGAMRWLLNYASDKSTEIPNDNSLRAKTLRTRFLADRDFDPIVDIWRTVDTVRNLAPEARGESLGAIFDMPDSKLRNRLLTNMPIGQIAIPEYTKFLPDSEIKAASDRVLPLFEEAQKRAKGPADYGAMRSWWERVSHNEEYADDQKQSRIRALLVDQLSPVHLARMMMPRVDQAQTDRLATENPSLVRELAKTDAEYWETQEQDPLNEEEIRLNSILKSWHEDRSLRAVADTIKAKVPGDDDEYLDRDMMNKLFGEFAKLATPEERDKTLTTLADSVLKDEVKDKHTNSGESQLATPLLLAARMQQIAPHSFETIFRQPIDSKLRDTHGDYNWRLSTAREIAGLQRDGEMAAASFSIPDLRLAKVKLSDQQQTELRNQFTEALFDEDTTKKLWGDGALGRLFPQYFGHYESEGGIVGRPQHGGHEFPVDEHTLLVMQRAREHKLFDTLPKKDQENLLAAVMMHDIAKRANMKDPDHEWVGANAAWGIISSLGYKPVRVQRIFDLVSRHSEVSFVPHEFASEAFKEKARLDDIANHYRYPNALTQLRIFNESDIRSIDSQSSLWTPNVEEELDTVQKMTEDRVQQLNGHIVPLLTNELPTKFSLVGMTGQYGLLAHASSQLHDSFLKQLTVIESPEYSISSTLVTDRVKQMYSDDIPLVALVAGPPEHISQANRYNLGTGGNVNWAGHIKLARDFAEDSKAKEFSAELNTLARYIDSPKLLKQITREKAEAKAVKGPRNENEVETPGSVDEYPHLQDARQELMKFDSIEDLINHHGEESSFVRLQRAFHTALTHDKAGKPLEEHNEIKLANPAFVGVGVFRKGQPVLLEGMTDSAVLDKLLNGQSKPSWLLTGAAAEANPPKKAVVIPKSTWETLLERDLPIVVLDP